jgi:cytochrome c-type biogenesis protein CcmH
MTLFVLAALLLTAAAAAFVAVPLLRARSDRPRAGRTAAAALLGIAVAGIALYGGLGDRAIFTGAPPPPGDLRIPQLARHLDATPQDRDGWLALGDAYGAIGSYGLALRCYQRANRLSAGSSAAALAGMAEATMLGGEAAAPGQIAELLERALKLDPRSPKALFYGAIDAWHDGRLDLARDRFVALLALNPPENIRSALQRQIEQLDAQRQGGAAAPAAAGAGAALGAKGPARVDAATAIHLHVTLSAALAGRVPPEASLFVFVPAPGGGPPLAVKRRAGELPQDVELSAADAMLAGRALTPGQQVTVVGRLSASGSALARRGDLFGEIHSVAGQGAAQVLEIDKISGAPP